MCALGSPYHIRGASEVEPVEGGGEVGGEGLGESPPDGVLVGPGVGVAIVDMNTLAPVLMVCEARRSPPNTSVHQPEELAYRKPIAVRISPRIPTNHSPAFLRLIFLAIPSPH